MWPVCVACGKYGTNLCEECARGVRFATRRVAVCSGVRREAKPLSSGSVGCGGLYYTLFGMYVYSEPLKTLLLRLKYRRDTFLVRTLSWYIYFYLSKDPFLFLLKSINHAFPTIIAIIPPRKESLKKRGFIPNELLLRPVNWENLGFFFYKHIFYPLSDIKPQHTLNAISRAFNLKRAFVLKREFITTILELKSLNISGINLILFDDVVSTGATFYWAFKKLYDLCNYVRIKCNFVGMAFLDNSGGV